MELLPQYVALNGVYWSNNPAPAGRGGIGGLMTVPKIVGTSTTNLAPGQPVPLYIAVDSSGVYWGNDGTLGAGVLMRVSLMKRNGDNARLQSGPGQGGVMRMALGGGPVTMLATSPSIRSLAVDTTSVYWTFIDSDTSGSVMKLTPK